MPTTGIQNALPANILDAVAVGVLNGSTFALPVKPGMLTWQTVFGSAPGSITVNLQMSNDGVNWTTMDTSTNVNGELRLLPSVAAIFVRAAIAAVVGGTTATVILVYRGADTQKVTFGQTLFTSIKQAGNVGVALTLLQSFDLPANTLVNNGDSLEIECWVFDAATANNKLTSIDIGAVTIAGRSGVADNGLPRNHRCTITRTGPSSAQAQGSVDTQGAGTLISLTALALSWNAIQTIRLQAQGGADNDIVSRVMRVKYYPIAGSLQT